MEQMKIDIEAHLKSRKEIEEIKQALKEKDDALWNEIDMLTGVIKEEEEPEKETGVEKIKKKIKESIGIKERKDKKQSKTLSYLDEKIRKLVGAHPEGEFYLPKGAEDKLQQIVYSDFIAVYDEIKGLFGGMTFTRH